MYDKAIEIFATYSMFLLPVLHEINQPKLATTATKSPKNFKIHFGNQIFNLADQY